MGAVEIGTREAQGARLIRRLRGWAWVHKWTSLLCTAFLLIICVTGLPLVFEDEIGQWLQPDPTLPVLPAGAPHVSLDRLASASRQMYPGQIITFVFVDHEAPEVTVSMAPSWQLANADPARIHWIKFDARTGSVVQQSKPLGEQHLGFLDIVYDLHTSLFARLPGELFMALMAGLFVAAIVSGVVLYGPFMKRLEFGTVRAHRARRLKWLDLHNLLGVVTVAWALVIGLTGIMNELSTPLFALWQRTEVQQALAPWRGRWPPQQSHLSPLQAAYDTAQRTLPTGLVSSIVYPGDADGSPYHYLVWTHGATPLTKRLFDPMLIDARSGRLTSVVRMPWYLRTLELCRPLHFGDYGSVPLKILWALLDLVTIAVLGSGLYLWLSRRRSPIERRLDDLESELALGFSGASAPR